MNKSNALELFADVATTVEEEGTYKYCDISDPVNMRNALNFYNRYLTFLSGRDKQDLLTVWHHACDDPRDTKLFLNAINILKEKYSKGLD